MKLPIALAVATGALLLTTPAFGQTVKRVVDGDTVVLSTGKVRLACIDAPETRQGAAGRAATAELKRLLPVGSTVTVRQVATDRYGRQVAELYQQGTNVNLALVESGKAFVYWKYIQGCSSTQYSNAESYAQRLGLGVHSDGTVKPWDWRRGHR